MVCSATELESRVLVLAPLGRDAELTCIALREAAIDGRTCADIEELIAEIRRGAAAVVIADEAFTHRPVDILAPVLSEQPNWSDLPVILLTSGGGSAIETRTTGEALASLGNVQLLERPTRVGTLLSVVRAALRARARQYQIRAHMQNQEQVELALRRSEFQLKFALEAAEFGAWDLDLTTGRAWRSLRHDQIFGYQELLSEWTYQRFLQHVHPDDRQRMDEGFRAALAAGEPWTFECRILRADGRERWIWGEANVQREPSGDEGTDPEPHPRMIGLVRDITERKITEEILARRTEELARSNAELQDFAYIASHDLKEPLRGISNYGRFLLDDEGDRLTDEGRERLHTVIRLSQRMYALLDSLLDYSRAGRTRLAINHVDLNILVAEVIDTMRPWLEERQTTVTIVDRLPKLNCDRVRASQIFMNLIANAAKYNESDIKRVEIGAAVDGGEAPVLYVRDNGIGIPDRHQATIFKMFRRLHGRERYGGGTGAGLALVKRIIERHGGRIWLESQPGSGSTFYFTLNLCGASPASSPGRQVVARASASRES